MSHIERFFWIIAIMLLCFFAYKHIEKVNMYKNQVNSINSENKEYRNKYNELVSERLIFEGEKRDLKAQIEIWKKNGDTLRTKLNSNIEQITLLKRKFRISNSGKNSKSLPDTVYIADMRVDTPIINIDTTDKFHSFKFAGNVNNFAYDIRIIDNAELVQEGDMVKLINNNPYIISSDVKTLKLKKKKPSALNKMFWFIIGAGAGYLVFR